MQFPVPVQVLGSAVQVGDLVGIQRNGKFVWHPVLSVHPHIHEMNLVVVAWKDGMDNVGADETLTVLRQHSPSGDIH